MLAALKVTVPLPVLVIPKLLAPSVKALVTVNVPVPPKKLLAPKVNEVLVPTEAVPVPESVPPFKVRFLKLPATPLISSVAPELTLTPALEGVNRALALVIESVPPLMLVEPV